MRTYKPLLTPRSHQLEYVARRNNIPFRPSNLDVFALLMEMGTGKTKCVLDEWGERVVGKDLHDLLVIAPAGSYRNWYVDQGEGYPSELRKQLDPYVFDSMVAAGWVSGGGAGIKAQLQTLIRTKKRPRALFINVEAFSSVEKAIVCAREFMEDGRRCMMVIDESTRIKNWTANRTEALEDLGKLAVARRIMSGLVTPNSPLDLFSQFYFLDWRILGHRSWFGFRARYAVMQRMIVHRDTPQERIVNMIVDYRNVPELNHKIAPYSFRKLKEECLDLPPKVYMPPRDVQLHDDQKRMYLQMREFGMAKLAAESFVTAGMVITQRIRLDQILCGFSVDDVTGELVEIKEYRTRELLFTLQEVHGKAVIWTTHDYCIRKLAEVLRKEFGPKSVAQFWGANRSTRHLDEARWKGDPDCHWMIATQSAGGVGNNWQMAKLTCYYNNSDNLEHRLQSEDRVHRDGLQDYGHKATYQDFIARNTLDERKVENLRNKIDLATIVNGDNYRKWLI